MTSRFIYFTTGAFLLAAAILFAAIQMTSQPKSLSEAQVRALVDQAIETKLADIKADAATTAPSQTENSNPIEVGSLDEAIETYLMANPSILQRMSVALQQETERQQAEQAQIALASMSDQIYNDPDHVVLGNPEGDVTLVEFFDYNCGFCRQALGDVLQLLDEDKNVRVILKEFPILSQGSADAARIAVLVARNKDIDYLDFHTKLFANRGQIDKQAALNAAQALGMNPIDLELQMGEASVTDAITRTYQVADALGVSSTPNFILGDELLRGAVGIDEIRAKIKNIRDCGKTVCNL